MMLLAAFMTFLVRKYMISTRHITTRNILVTNKKLQGITNDTSMRHFHYPAGGHEVMQLLAGSRPAGQSHPMGMYMLEDPGS